ncbi:hypothetical protein HCZ82_09720, partial [Limosilactobacillus fermentum]
ATDFSQWWLTEGQVVDSGAPEQVLSAERVSEVFNLDCYQVATPAGMRLFQN